MNPSLVELQRIAELEFAGSVVDSQLLGEKLRLYLSDDSFVDVWVARKQQGRFGFHWERRHLDGTLYRYDNFPDTDWQVVETYPFHFHDGSQANVTAAPFSPEIRTAFREFLRFAQTKLSAQLTPDSPGSPTESA